MISTGLLPFNGQPYTHAITYLRFALILPGIGAIPDVAIVDAPPAMLVAKPLAMFVRLISMPVLPTLDFVSSNHNINIVSIHVLCI